MRYVVGKERTHWGRLAEFFDTVFLPYLIGGLIPGAVASVAGYLVARPLIAAYQRRRRRKLAEKWAKLQASALQREHVLRADKTEGDDRAEGF